MSPQTLAPAEGRGEGGICDRAALHSPQKQGARILRSLCRAWSLQLGWENPARMFDFICLPWTAGAALALVWWVWGSGPGWEVAYMCSSELPWAEKMLAPGLATEFEVLHHRKMFPGHLFALVALVLRARRACSAWEQPQPQ